MISLNWVKVEFKKFPNNELNLIHESVLRNINDTLNNVTMTYEGDEDLIKLLFLKKFMDNVTKAESKLIISYMPYSRMDRSENESPFTLKYISEFINGLDFDSVHVLEPHSNVTPALLNNVTSHFIDQDFVETLFNKLGMDKEFDYVMFPDNGASNRYKSLKFKNVLVGHKNRDFVTGQITNLNVIGEVVNPSKVLIVDDLSSYGGTFVHSSKKLRELGFEKVYLYVTHAENSVFKGELFNNIDKLITTDSILTEQNNWENKKYSDQIEIIQFETLLK